MVFLAKIVDFSAKITIQTIIYNATIIIYTIHKYIGPIIARYRIQMARSFVGRKDIHLI